MTSLTDLLRLFADPKKVKLLGHLCDDSLPLHTLASAAGLSEAETMQLVQSLQKAGLLEETFAADGFRWQYKPSAIFEALRETKAAAGPTDLPPGASVFDAKVLGDFFVNGRLKVIPVQRKKREVVLRYLAEKFDPGRTYTEQEVSFLLLNYHEDYASLRREMVDTGLMERANGIYRRTPVEDGRIMNCDDTAPHDMSPSRSTN
jgi:ArsR family transcriptional regulator